MKKIFLYILFLLFISFFSFLYYFSFVGIQTKSFNNKIKDSINKFDKNLGIHLDYVKLYLNIKDLNVEAKISNPKIIYKNEDIEIESVKSLISIRSAINQEFALNNLDISSKSIKIQKILSLIGIINNSPEIFILKNKIKGGSLVGDIKLNFDENGKIRKDFEINGYLRDGQLDLLSEHKLHNINFIFKIKNNNYELKDINFLLDEFDFSSKKISLSDNDDFILVEGDISNELSLLKKEKIDKILRLVSQNNNFEKILFSSKNNFSFKIDNKLKFSEIFLNSEISLKNLAFKNNKKGKYFFPKINNELFLKNHNINLNIKNDVYLITGSGNLILQDKIDRVNYSIKNKDTSYQIKTSIELNQNPLLIEFLNYKKDDKSKATIQTEFFINKKKNINIKSIKIKETDNKFIVENVFLDKDFKIIKIDKIDLNYIDKDNIENSIKLTRNKGTYNIFGKIFNANNLVDKVLNSEGKTNYLFKDDFDVNLKIGQIHLDKDEYLKNLEGNLSIKNSKVYSTKISSVFSNNEKFILSIKSKDNQKITNFFSEKAKPIVKRYKFIKGFEEGTLEFYSKKIDNNSTSSLKIFDFKLQELPALTKLLTLASLQGIADTLTGEGIRFKELEMNFNNQGNLMTIDELYAIGPAISVLMNGYIEKDKLVSLRGTLVPATTINKTIGSIPFLGKILVGSKAGEGVFGVSFKIKGHPSDLETNVNPIKTLTPRFITRTLEKIKKTN